MPGGPQADRCDGISAALSEVGDEAEEGASSGTVAGTGGPAGPLLLRTEGR